MARYIVELSIYKSDYIKVGQSDKFKNAMLIALKKHDTAKKTKLSSIRIIDTLNGITTYLDTGKTNYKIYSKGKEYDYEGKK